ncbi:MAG: MFS transporter [Marinilabiliaceae bacterium]
MDKEEIYSRRNFYLILAVTLLSVIGVPSIIPVFPEMSEALDVSRNKIGLFITVFTLPGAFLALFLGMVTDRYGRKPILLMALVLFGISGTACFFFRDFEIILVLRAFQGLGAACLGIINITLIGDIFTGEEKARVMGYVSGSISVGSAVFPVVGGLLAAFGWHYPFLLPSLALVVAVLVYFYLNNPEPLEKPRLNNYLKNVAKSVLSKNTITLFLLCFVSFVLLFGVLMTYMPILLKDHFEFSSTEIGVVFFFIALSAGAVASRLGFLMRHFSMKTLVLMGIGAFLTGMGLIPFAGNLWVLILLLLLTGAGQGVNIPIVFHVLTSIAPLEHRGAFMSVNSMTIRAGQTVGPLVAGVLYGLGGLSWVFWSGAIAAAVFMLYIIFFVTSFGEGDEVDPSPSYAVEMEKK